MLHIAIIGSGPAGCYLADSLLRLAPDASIDIIERLPVPFGLVRHGVAPDHQSTKGVARVLDRVLARDGVSFFGNVEVGHDVRLEELLQHYDAVALATGATRDRRLGIPGEDLPGVVGSGAFVNWYNGHPDYPAPFLREVRSAVVIGNGNVAIDVARILAKNGEELAGSDLSAEVTSLFRAQPIEAIHIVGRRGPSDAKFTVHELAELGTLKRAQPVVAPEALAGEGAVVETLRSFSVHPPGSVPVAIYFHFNMTPVAFIGDERLRGVQFRAADGSPCELPAQLAVTCIGYETQPCCSEVPANGVFANDEGKIRDGLYVVGWAKRGPSGTIPTNRSEAQQVAQRIAREVLDRQRGGGAELRKTLTHRNVEWVDCAGWRRIDAAELAAAIEGRCRQKLGRIADMLQAAKPEQVQSTENFTRP